MDLKTTFARAKRGIKEDVRLYVVAVWTLTVAFLFLAASLLAMANLSQIADRWGQSGRLTIYLRDGARPSDVEQLRMALEALPEVREIEQVSPSTAREQFLDGSSVSGELAALPPDVFPSSLDVTIAPGTPAARLTSITERIARFGAVEGAETYRSWFDRVDALLAAAGVAAGIVALLVAICVIAVVANTIRLAVAGRRDEIEVLKLCGATDGFVRGPFLVEGAAQGLAYIVVDLANQVFRLLVVFVIDLTDNFFQHVFYSHQPGDTAELVEHHGNVRAAFLKPLQEVVDRLGFRHEQRLAQ